MQSSKSKGPLVPRFDVAVNGKSLPAETIAYITDLTVDQSVELPDMFTFALASSDAQDTKLPWADNQDVFMIGNRVEIKMGYPGILASVMIGEITSLEPEFVVDRLPSLRVRGYARRHRLQRGRKTRSFIQQKDSDIASQIGGEAGLTVRAADSGTSLDYVLQANQTDWEFLCARASQIRYEVVVQDKTLLFQPVANNQSKVLTLDMEHGLLEFYPRLSSAGQVTEVKVQSWSVKDKKALVGDSKGGCESSNRAANPW